MKKVQKSAARGYSPCRGMHRSQQQQQQRIYGGSGRTDMWRGIVAVRLVVCSVDSAYWASLDVLYPLGLQDLTQ